VAFVAEWAAEVVGLSRPTRNVIPVYWSEIKTPLGALGWRNDRQFGLLLHCHGCGCDAAPAGDGREDC